MRGNSPLLDREDPEILDDCSRADYYVSSCVKSMKHGASTGRTAFICRLARESIPVFSRRIASREDCAFLAAKASDSIALGTKQWCGERLFDDPVCLERQLQGPCAERRSWLDRRGADTRWTNI